MKALVLESIGNLTCREVPMPQIKEDEVLLKVKASGICNSDIDRVFKTGAYHFPLIPGHEFSGKVVAVGSKVSDGYLNRRAVVFPMRPCMECAYCREEEYALCENYNYFGSRCDGGFAEYLAVPVWNLVTFQETIPYDQAAMCEPAAVALHGIRRGNVKRGDSVLVVGMGTIGLLAALWLRVKDAGHVVCVVRNSGKADFLRKIGLEEIINISEESIDGGLCRLGLHQRIDVALECSGNAESVGVCIDGVRKGGRIVLYSNPTGDICLSRDTYWKILRKQLGLFGTWNSSYGSSENDWRETICAMSEKKLDAGSLITHRFPLEESDAAFCVLTEKRELAIKVMFMMGNAKDE